MLQRCIVPSEEKSAVPTPTVVSDRNRVYVDSAVQSLQAPPPARATNSAALNQTALALGCHHEEYLGLHVVVTHALQSGHLGPRKLSEDPGDGKPQLQLGQMDPEAYYEQVVSQSVVHLGQNHHARRASPRHAATG